MLWNQICILIFYFDNPYNIKKFMKKFKKQDHELKLNMITL